MVTEKQKMLSGDYADTSDTELQKETINARRKWMRLNNLHPDEPEYRLALKELVPSIPDSSVIMAPFYCDYAGDRLSIGENVFINYNCNFLDGGTVTIGNHTLIGPAVQIYTPQHPLDYVERRKTIEKSLAVVIGSDCWIGGGAVICPGVTIGDRCIIGAGAVVTKDIPDGSLAVGNPAKVIREL